jgi:dTMP kinase
MSGRFIVLEGADGVGKSTQSQLLADWIRSHNVEAIETREPGGTPYGVRIRAILLDQVEPLDARSEALLMAADRAHHLAELIRPAQGRGDWVISDRHVPSSLVYQGVARGLGVEEVAAINKWATAGSEPDLVVVLDLPDSEVDARRTGRLGASDRLELEGDEFHASVRSAYRSLALERGWEIIDASGEQAEVAKRVIALVEARLGRPTSP